MIPAVAFMLAMLAALASLAWLFHDYEPERPDTQGWGQ